MFGEGQAVADKTRARQRQDWQCQEDILPFSGNASTDLLPFLGNGNDSNSILPFPIFNVTARTRGQAWKQRSCSVCSRILPLVVLVYFFYYQYYRIGYNQRIARRVCVCLAQSFEPSCALQITSDGWEAKLRNSFLANNSRYKHNGVERKVKKYQ